MYKGCCAQERPSRGPSGGVGSPSLDVVYESGVVFTIEGSINKPVIFIYRYFLYK